MARVHADATRHQVARGATWQRLLRYRASLLPASFDGSFTRSNIITDSFFVAPLGRTQPERELHALIDALAAPIADDPDHHALCRFPARSIHLRASLGWPRTDPFELCPALQDWAQIDDVGGLSLLFATGYFSNPGSVYGHLLVKLRSAEHAPTPALLERSFNYGAASSENDGFIPYVVKGLLGGYHSRYTTLEFYRHDRRYRELEHRDLWEYELSLSREELRLIVAHLWELQGQENRYYFLWQNCAYRIAELLEVVTEEELLPRGKVWMTPMDLLQRIARVRRENEEPVLSRVELHRSRFSRFVDAYRELDESTQGWVRARIHDHEHIGPSLNEEQRAAGLNALIDFYTYERRSESGRAEDIETRMNEALLERLALPALSSHSEWPERDPPHTGQPSSRLSMTGVLNETSGAGFELRLRPANHGFLALEPGVRSGSELSMVDVRLRGDEDDLWLRSAEIIRVTSLSPNERLPLESARSWRMRFGAEVLGLSSGEDLVPFVEGGLGLARQDGALATYALGVGRVQLPGSDRTSVEAGPTVGAILRGGRWSARLESTYLVDVSKPADGRARHLLEVRMGRSRTWDFRIGAEYLRSLEGRVSIGYFW